MFVKTDRTTPQKEELNICNLDIVYLINSLTMVYGKLNINGYGMNIACFPKNCVEIEFSSCRNGTGGGIEEVIRVLPSSIGESGHVIERMVAQWVI